MAEHRGHHGHEHHGHEAAPVPVSPEPAAAGAPVEGTIYTCPMHPQIRQPAPGHCPICGMALEPVMPTLEEGENAELTDFRRRFWWTLPLTLVVVFIAMAGHIVFPGWPASARTWTELVLATPVVLWAAWPFFVRCWSSIRTRNPNMWTLIGIGVAAAYTYSVIAAVAPGIFPAGF